jgi:MSHA biogenesis protein MshN
MSVINQMLVDLERRRASGEERNRIPDHVRALPGDPHAAGQSAPWMAAAAVVVLALLAAGGWWWFYDRMPVVMPVYLPPPVAAVVPPAPEPRAGELIARRLTLDLAQVPEVAELPPAAPEREVGAGIATSSIVSSRSAPATQPPLAPPTVVSPERPRVAPAPAPAPKKPVEVDKAPPASPRAEIDKQVREPTPRQRANAEYAKGAAALYRGESGEARVAFETALQMDPLHHGARQALVGVLLDGRRQAEAIGVLQQGLQLAPAQHGFAMALARLQVESNELDAGVQTLARSLDYPGVSPDYLGFYAGLLQRQQKHAEAVTQFQRALERRGNVGVWLLGMGVSLEALGRGAEAQEAYRRAQASGNLSAELQTFASQRLR